MAIRAQAIKVKTADLLDRVKQAQARNEIERDSFLAKAGLARAEKIAELQKQIDSYAAMSNDEFARQDYRYNRKQVDDFSKIIVMLEIAADEIMTISADSDLAKYL